MPRNADATHPHISGAGREGAGAGGACGTGHAEGRLKIRARGWWESLFLPLTDKIITVDSHALEETEEASWSSPCAGIAVRAPQGRGGGLEAERRRSAQCSGAGEASLRNEFEMRTKERRFVSHEKREVML